jgi:hypothetical protein
MNPDNIELPSEYIADFCRRWLIVEFAIFGLGHMEMCYCGGPQREHA